MTLKNPLRTPAVLILILSSLPAFSETLEPRRGTNAFVCGTSGRREDNARAAGKYQESLMWQRARRGPVQLMQAPAPPASQADVGDVALIQDDGTMISQARSFNLSPSSFRFEPAGSGAYRVVPSAGAFSDSGASIILADDDTAPQNLGFSFPFYGNSYTSVQINSDGNLTFTRGDVASTERDLGRFTSGPPRIGALFVDLDPSGGGKVTVRSESDGIVFSWSAVPNFGLAQLNSFSMKLFRTGAIEFVYGTVSSIDAVVGISPGGGNASINALDFALDLPTGNLSGTISEVFTQFTSIVDTYIARAFYRNHPDAFDQVIVLLGFDFDLGGGAFAYEINVKNDVRGINLNPGIDNSALWGSSGRLTSFVNMGSLDGAGRYPSDPNQVFLGSNSTLSVMGQEVGHRFLAFTPWQDGAASSNTILGRDLAHWSFFFNSFGSVMEGNEIQDSGGIGNRRFLTVGATNTYSLFDQYLMGLVGREAVPPSFVVENPTGTSRQAASNPSIGVTFGGDRREVTIDHIIAVNGNRIPSVNQAPKVFRQAFVLLTRNGQSAIPDQIAKVQGIRDAWASFFNRQTGGRGWSVTDLQDSPGTTPTEILFPYFQGNTRRYTGIAIANWGSTPADVFFTAYDNAGRNLPVPGIINPRVVTIGPGAQIAMLGEQIHGIALDDPRNGWISARSTSSRVSGFFLDGDIDQTLLSGAVAGNQTNRTLYFTRAQVGASITPGNDYRNLLNVVNPSEATAQVTLELYDDSSNLFGRASRTLPPKARISQDLPDIFPQISLPDGGYVKATADQGLIGYQSIDSGTTVYSLGAQASSTATNLYSAQFASGRAGTTQYFTELNLVNTAQEDRSVQILLVDKGGSTVNVAGNPAIVQIRAGHRSHLRGEALYGLPDAASASTITEGSLVLTSDGLGVIGDVLFGDAVAGRFLAALPLDGNPVTDMVLSQVAQGVVGGSKPYFTGIALYNPGPGDATVTLDVFSEQGDRTGSTTFPLPGRNRISSTLPELVPGLTRQERGYIRIHSTSPIVGYELFGDQQSSFLAPVPPQPINP